MESDAFGKRGRVGRSNKKAFCYLITPPLNDLTPEARQRLKAIEELAELGSGINIALRDLDIRGAGNLLGGVYTNDTVGEHAAPMASARTLNLLDVRRGGFRRVLYCPANDHPDRRADSRRYRGAERFAR